LFAFLSSNRNAILFLALEAFALYLVVHANDQQRHRMGDVLLEVSGVVGEKRSGVTSYFNLRRDNEQLLAAYDSIQGLYEARVNDLARLRAELSSDSLTQTRLDSLLATPQDSFHFIPAQVVRNSTHKAYNYLTLDQGTLAGVTVDMGVVAPNGVVGRVIKVSERYALVQSAINVDFKLAVMVLNRNVVGQGNLGFYEWNGTDIRYGQVSYVPETAALTAGDWVVTAGSSTIFPKGFKVGQLADEALQPSEGFYNVGIQLAVDFSALNHVFVIKADHKADQDSLEVNLPQGNE
jgi:rod shape-determining protein MreC